MRHLYLFLCFLATVSANAAIPDTGRRNVVTDYPEALQKAGVKNVRCIFKDSRKLLWIGTENGLYRYDGTNVDLLEHDADNPQTIPSNNIISLAEDKNGKVWAGTLQGAARIDAWSLKCTVYNKSLHNLDGDFDLKIYCAPDGEIWAGSSTGLSLLDTRSNIFKNVWHDQIRGELNAGYVNYVTDWKADTLLAGTFHGLVLVCKKNYGFRRINPAPLSLTVMRIYVDPQKRIWMGTWGNGLMVSDSAARHFTTLAWEKLQNHMVRNVVTGIISTTFDHRNRLWVSTSRGVYELELPRDNLSGYRAIPVSLDQNGFIYSVMADDDHYIWTSGSSVSRFFAGNGFFKTLPVFVNGTTQRIQPVFVGGKKLLVLSSWYKPSGLLFTDLNGQSLYRQPDQKNPDASNISGVAEDKFHRFWVSSLAGLSVLNSNLKPAAPDIFSGGDRPSTQKTNGIMIDHDTVWVACYRHGIDLYDLNFHKIKSFSPGDGSGLGDDLFNGFYAGPTGEVWLFGDYRLYRYDRRAGHFHAYNFNKDGAQFTVNEMARLPGGDLLVASSSGLYRFNAQTGVHSRIESPLLSRERQVQSVCVDDHGDVWFTNNERLVYYQGKTQHFTLFGTEDGLNNHDEAQWLATFDGKMIYMSEGKTVVAFSPANQRNAVQPINLYIHAVQANDSTLSRDALGDQLKLNYTENKLNLEFGAINYIKPGQNLYAYRLGKVDARWITTTHNFASYANLAPGKYTFTVKAENYAGLWSKPLLMQIEITPPFWATWWFRLLAFAMVSAAAFFAIRYVVQHNLRERILYLEKEKAVEQERNRIARDMHDDLGSGLTKIAVMSEVTKAQLGNHGSATEYLDVISTASRELVDNLQGIIWVLNPQNDSVESLVLYLKEYSESFFEHTNMNLQFNYEDGFGHISLSEEKRRNIFLVVKESCNNALKHSGGTLININIKIKQALLLIEIADNGGGFETDRIALFSNGLQNMKNRIQQIGGEFQLVSATGEGTCIGCRIPI